MFGLTPPQQKKRWAKIHKSTDQLIVGNGLEHQINYEQVDRDNYGFADIANSEFVIPPNVKYIKARAGVYYLNPTGWVDEGGFTGLYLELFDGVNWLSIDRKFTFGYASGEQSILCESQILPVVEGNRVRCRIKRHTTFGDINLVGQVDEYSTSYPFSPSFMEIEEIK